MGEEGAMEMSGAEGRGNGDEGWEDDVGAESEEWRKMERRVSGSGDVVDQRRKTGEKLPKCELENNKEELTDEYKERQTRKRTKSQSRGDRKNRREKE